MSGRPLSASTVRRKCVGASVSSTSRGGRTWSSRRCPPPAVPARRRAVSPSCRGSVAPANGPPFGAKPGLGLLPPAVEREGQHFGEMQRLATGELRDLLAAAEAVGDDQGCRICFPHRRKQHPL